MIDQLETRDEIVAALARKVAAQMSLADFAKRMMPNYEFAPHNLKMIDRLEALERGDIRRLMIACPPQHGKSTLCSQIFPAWHLGRNPEKKIVLASYGAELASRNSAIAREHVRNENFPFDLEINPESRAKDRWDIQGHRGSVYAVGVGGALTGQASDVFVADDLVKDYADAKSDVIRESTWDWWLTVAMTRLSRDYRIVLCNTRWHFDDPQARILEAASANEWEVLKLPALSEGADVDPLRRPEGSSLWPSFKSAEELQKMKSHMGTVTWRARSIKETRFPRRVRCSSARGSRTPIRSCRYRRTRAR